MIADLVALTCNHLFNTRRLDTSNHFGEQVNVYIVLEESGSCDDHDVEVVGVFTDVDEARTVEAGKRHERHIETWSVGANSEHQVKTLHVVKQMVANPNFLHANEVVWSTHYRSYEVDASTLIESYDYVGAQDIRRGGWTRAQAEERLNEALKDFTPDLAPLPKEFRWPARTLPRYVEMFANKE